MMDPKPELVVSQPDMDEFSATRAALHGVAQAFERAGHDLYLVGGVVRDTLLGHVESPDIDATTDARPERIKSLLAPFADAMWSQGERFGTIGAKIAGYDVEVTTYRADSYEAWSRKPDVAFGYDLLSDLVRRDFTINAMAVSLIDGSFHDPFGGVLDLRRRILQTPLDPEVSFDDDPLRMLRAARFVARFGLSTSPRLAEAARRLSDRLDIVSSERVHDELERLLDVAEPSAGFEFLVACHLFDRMLGIETAAEDRAIALTAVERVRGVGPRRAALLAPFGPKAASAILSRLRYSTDDRRWTERTIALVGSLPARTPDPAGVRRLVADAGGDVGLVTEVLCVAGVLHDASGFHRGCSVDPAMVDAWHDLLDRLAVTEDLSDRGLPVDGSVVMSLLGIEAGPLVGRALAHLAELRIEQGPMTRDEAVARLRRWASDTV